MAKNIIIITGASSGIGKEFVHRIDLFFKKIDEIWLIARSADKLQELSCNLNHRAKILSIDITKESQIEELSNELHFYKPCIRVLINCAGYGLMGDFAKTHLFSDEKYTETTKAQLGMIRLNCEALTHVTHICIPYMKKGSRIIQLASSAAYLPQPYFAVYAATKSYVLSFSRALGEELRSKEIYVTSVCPGPVDTPFLENAYQNSHSLGVKKFTMVTADKVVRKALKDSYYKRAFSVCSFPIRAFIMLTKCVPHRFLLTIMRFLK